MQALIPDIESDTTFLSSTAKNIREWDQDLFPICQELITLIRTIDGLDDEELAKLKKILVQISIQQTGLELTLTQDEALLTPAVKYYLQVVLKLHQVLALIDADFNKVITDKVAHSNDLIAALNEKNGLEYAPRERSVQGRVFEHAADSKILLDHLLSIKLVKSEAKPLSPLFFISTRENHTDAIIKINKKHVDMTLQANGKAELYFHAYFWTTYFSQIMAEGDNSELMNCPQVKRLQKVSEKTQKIFQIVEKGPYNEKEHQSFTKEFCGNSGGSVVHSRLITKLQNYLFVAQITGNKDSLRCIEKTLIQLLGYVDINVRDEAVILLNMLYDEHDWQMSLAFKPVVRCVGQHFKVQLNVITSQCENQQLFLGLSAPSPLSLCHQNVITWHKLEKHNILSQSASEAEISINFGKFWKCGFYDWRLVQVKDDGSIQPLFLKEAPTVTNFPFQKKFSRMASELDFEDEPEALISQGRYVVQSKGMHDHSFHEVQVDYQNAKVDYSTKSFQKRGTFNDVERAIPGYIESGITALYLMGVFQRDNCPMTGSAGQFFAGKGPQYKKENASALSVTSRDVPCEMLGGAPGFRSMMSKAKKEGVKIIVDCLARISSSRHHRKYRELLLHYLDEDGKRHICYGTDGQSLKYEDSAMLNYRKLDAWEILVEEVVSFATTMGVDGIHLDNGQAWPQILEVDWEELNRKDVDDQPAYTQEQKMNGEIVVRNENHGYWNTNNMDNYPNPFFVKLCKRLWSINPDFMIVGECWGGNQFEHRQIILARSGVIPRLFKLPQTICSLFGKKLHRDGRLTNIDKKESVLALRKWYDESRLHVPDGTIMLQSSTAHSWPYPAYLYGRGTWAAVDILFFLPDIPITFMGELDGEIYRLGQGSVFQAEQQEIRSGGSELKRSNSQVRLALDKADITETEFTNTTGSLSAPATTLVRVRSGSNLAALVVEQSQSAAEMTAKEQKFQSLIGSSNGFDLKKISSHYTNRRQLRAAKMVFRYGELCPLIAKNSDVGNEQAWITDVLSFARYSLMETALISINLSDTEQSFFVDLERLYKTFSKTINDNTVIMTQSLLDSKNQTLKGQDFFFLREFMAIKHWQTLAPFSTSIQLITVCQDDKFTFQRALQSSIERTKVKLQNGKDIEAEQISLLIIDALNKKSSDASYFAGLVGSLQENFLDRINMTLNDLVIRNSKLRQSSSLMGKLLALCDHVSQSKVPPSPQCKIVAETNRLGPIVFCTPELGRWSTVGGLGVMVDELSCGLVNLGQEVIVISPYYDKNRKGQTGYLAQDPAGIRYVDNITITLDTTYTLGVHEGMAGGVRVVFLHHSEIFPVPYAEINAAATVRQLAVFGKACLEYCCKRTIIPSVCITNDWFTGFVPAYAKLGSFGPTFKGTTFLHICHNLMEDYEGRIYPEAKDGWLQTVHQLPRDWLIDPGWSKFCINPSRCAIMMSDQWSTVSKSYKDDLLRDSPLNPLLRQKPKPFAFPNGIPISDRIKKLDAAAPNHLAAKKLLQIKYFNFNELDDSIPLFSFVGRITTQKGVHLILDIVEPIIHKCNYKVQFIVGGPANMRDPYSASCANRMWSLKQKYPHCFWAAPEEFFMDGAVVNRGSDFGLMPSLFEPGGIVQHEFFVGETPVIAFRTGGLKDSVHEFQWDSETGSGFTFESYKKEDFIFAIERSLGVYTNKAKYLKLRQNAFNATMPGEIVCKAWLQEFCRLREKIFFDFEAFSKTKDEIQDWIPRNYKPLNLFDEMFGSEINKLYSLDDIDFGAEEGVTQYKKRIIMSEFDRIQQERVANTFMLHNRGPRHQKVEICGSFDNWEKRHVLQFDHITNQWFATLNLSRGDHFYKYVINETLWVVNEEERQCKDKAGNINNFISL